MLLGVAGCSTLGQMDTCNELGTCYWTRAKARVAARRYFFDTGKFSAVYRCSLCGFWHFGSEQDAALHSSGPVYATFVRRKRQTRN